MNEKPKNELMFLQNEILGDIKTVENKLDSKIFKVSESLDEQKVYYDKKINSLENIINIIKEKVQTVKTDNSNEKELLKINSLTKKIEDYYSKLDSKITLLKADLMDTSYKYEKSLVTNFQIPSLIGERCLYSSLRDFLENMHKKINENLRNRELQKEDLKKYKEKIESVISQNKNHLPMFENKVIGYFDSQIKEIDDKYKKKVNTIEEEINNMKIQNEKNFSELTVKCNNLNGNYIKMYDIISNSFSRFNQELDKLKNSFKDMNLKIKSFEEQFNNINEKLSMINELNESIKQIKNGYNRPLTKKEVIENYEENKDNIHYRNDNYIDYNLQNEEMEINSLINSKQNENRDDNLINKLTQNERNIKIEMKKKYNKNNYCNLIRYYSKKRANSNFFDDSYEYTKINNIIFDAEFFKKSNFLGNSGINDYYNQNYKIKKSKNLYNRIKSGKASHHFPFTTNDNINDEQYNLNSRNKRNSLSGDLDINNNSIKNNNLKEDYDNKKEYTIYGNMYRSQNTIKRKNDLESNDTYFSPSHKYSYLDKKINILGNVMVDSINKLIYQIKYLKKNCINNKIILSEKNNGISLKNKSLKSSLSDVNVLYSSPLNKDDSNLKKYNHIKKGKANQKYKILSQDNENKKF